ncbi:hypothetical protein C8R44DRAFT_738914 [Mycena epipterygia]|nr:hypothetical protein C8R44DRAFT_738914 [Mycena epipterygia]
MREFEAGHQARLESAAPYRLPESQYTPQTPLFLPDPQDRATPTPPPAALPQSVSAESSQAERLTASKRELGSDDNASSPPKRRRVQQKSIAEFFDTAAEESEEEGVSEEEDEEDEETLSDQEFLDDEPTHDSPAFYHNLDQDNAADEIAAAEFSAARLDQAAAGYSKAVEAERRGKIPPPALIMPDAGDAGQCSPGASDWMQRTISNAVITSAPAQLPRTFASQRRATSRRTESKEDPVPGTWIRISAGSDRNSVALVLHNNECLVYVGNRRCKTVPLPADYQPVWPTRTDLVNFHDADSVKLSRVHFVGTCSALTEGDRVVVVNGSLMYSPGYITLIRDVPAPDTNHNIRVRYAKVQSRYNGTAVLSKADEGYFIPVADLRRHVLDDPIPIGPLDRVRVVSGNQYLGYSGRVISLGESSLAVEISKPPLDMEVRLIDFPLRQLTRDFRPGDMVQVVRGESKDRTGFITTSEGSREIRNGPLDNIDHVMPYLIFKVRSADVVFSLSASTGLSGVKQGFTTRSEVSAIPNNMTPNTEHGESMNLHMLLEDLQEQDRIAIERNMRLMKTGRRFEGLEVLVAYKHPLKGVLCVVHADHDTPKRAARLAKESKRKGWRGDKADIRGIVATVSKLASNTRFEVDVKNLVHAHTRLPLNKAVALSPEALAPPPVPPTPPARTPSPQPVDPASASAWMIRTPTPPPILPGEDNGEWLCIPGLARKRVDVEIRGIDTLEDNKRLAFKNSASLRRLEGRSGYLLLEDALTTGMVGMKKLKVYAVGQNMTAHNVPAQCIKPFRGLTDMPLTRFKSRVVIIGADITGNPTCKGLYGETQPPDHYDGTDTVRVRFQPRVESRILTFPLLSLCQAKNDSIIVAHGKYLPTDFDEML